MNVQEASKRLHKSEATIRRWIRQGKLAATMVDGAYDIPESAVNEQSMSGQMTDDDLQGDQATIAVMRAHIQSLERQIEERDNQINTLQIQLSDASQRHDTVVMQMARMIEYERQPFWRRWRRRKALPPHESIVDMESETGQADSQINSPPE